MRNGRFLAVGSDNITCACRGKFSAGLEALFFTKAASSDDLIAIFPQVSWPNPRPEDVEVSDAKWSLEPAKLERTSLLHFCWWQCAPFEQTETIFSERAKHLRRVQDLHYELCQVLLTTALPGGAFCLTLMCPLGVDRRLLFLLPLQNPIRR